MSYKYDYSPKATQQHHAQHEERHHQEHQEEQEQQQQQQQQLRGKQLWRVQRKQWTTASPNTCSTTSAASVSAPTSRNRIPLDRTFDYDQIIDDIVNEAPFAAAVPLPLLVDTLVDLWEGDGLFE